ncbi:MAG: DUF3071 domain-containing protein [Salinibacterium sp.]|nr:DUF3071 domain-containing protein [Salinibacterium sp.]
MHDLSVVGVEKGALLVASDDGTRFRVPVDESIQSRLRQAVPDQGAGRKLAPKEIQAHIRAGMSAQDVAAITGVAVEYIQRFEGPVLAEREFVIESALAVHVHTAADVDPLGQGKTFGIAIRERLHDLGGVNERWASWKELGSGWIVKLSFTAREIGHDARWQFDPRKRSLAPLNNEAVALSQQGDGDGILIPRLRAVTPSAPTSDSSRFDSGAFEPQPGLGNRDLDKAETDPVKPNEPELAATGPLLEAVPFGRIARRELETSQPGHQTADLLEALRRRRGERESANFDDEPPMTDQAFAHPSTGSIRLVNVPLDDFLPEQLSASPRSTAPQRGVRGKKGRAAMPSWDEIVFGARPDDDLA